MIFRLECNFLFLFLEYREKVIFFLVTKEQKNSWNHLISRNKSAHSLVGGDLYLSGFNKGSSFFELFEFWMIICGGTSSSEDQAMELFSLLMIMSSFSCLKLSESPEKQFESFKISALTKNNTGKSAKVLEDHFKSDLDHIKII